MYLKINNVLRPLDEATVSISYEPQYDVRRRVILVDEVWQISGRVILQTNAGQSQMTAALRKLDQDFGQFRPNLTFVEDNGSTETFKSLLRRDCIEGPTIRNSQLPQTEADIYATGAQYAITFVGTKPIAKAGADVLLSFTESVTNSAGGLKLGYVGGAINLPELQVFKQHEAWEYVQEGSAVGLYGYPKPPPPIWPRFQVEANRPSLQSPRVLGQVNREYETRWRYRFVSPYALAGRPHTT